MTHKGNRKLGRYLKRGSKVLGKVVLNDFSFGDISDAPTIDHDNARRNVIMSEAHDEAELRRTVLNPEKFNEDLLPRELKRPIIKPIDFTLDWERSKKLNRRSHRIDDDEFEFDYEAAQRLAEDAKREKEAADRRAESPPPAAAPVLDATPVKDATPMAVSAKAVPTPGAFAPSGKNQYQSMDVVGQDIMTLAHKTRDPLTEAVARPVRIAETPETPGTPDAASKMAASSNPADANARDFIPMRALGREESNPEDAAQEAYRQHLVQDRLASDEAARLIEEAKAQGYRDGFRNGEEKAELHARQEGLELFSKVSDLIREFEGLKHNVLANVQENFYELSQAMAEALIKREFTIHPEAFVTVLKRALSEAVAPGKVKIRVHPDTLQRVATLGNQDILANMIKDNDIPPGDFKIESELSVVNVNVGKLIRELLDKADVQLFSQDEKAS